MLATWPARMRTKCTLPDGMQVELTVRKQNPYGPNFYSMALSDGNSEVDTDRPGQNPESVTNDVEDVYINVAKLETGSMGSVFHNIAATNAHNTGRLFIGNPAGLLGAAMRHRLENVTLSPLNLARPIT